MKKLLLVLLLFTGMVNAQIVNIVDANFKVKLLQANTTNNQIAFDINNFPIKIDINNNNEIELSEALLVNNLYLFSSNIGSSIGIESFTNLTKLDCSNNLLSSINVNTLTNLLSFRCSQNKITSLNLIGLNNLTELYCDDNQLTSLESSGLTNLETLYCGYNPITVLNVAGLSNLTDLKCSNSQLTSLNLNGLTNLLSIDCGWSLIQSLNLSGLTNLKFLNCENNQLTTIDLSGLNNIKTLNCSINKIQNLDVNSNTTLEELVCFMNKLTTLEINNLVNLIRLSCEQNSLTELNVVDLINLQYLFFSNNVIKAINLNGLVNLEVLTCSFNQLTSIDLSGLVNLKNFQCTNNGISTLNLSDCKLTTLDCRENNINSLDVADLVNAVNLYYGSNFIPDLDLSGLVNLSFLDCRFTGRNSLDVSKSPNLTALYCGGNFISTLDVSSLLNLDVLSLEYSYNLSTLFMKNGRNEQTVSLFNCSSLQYVCADEGQIANIQQQLVDYAPANSQCNSYCNFTLGGNYNTITGIALFDENNNGCDDKDLTQPNIRFNINDGITEGSAFTNALGNFVFYTQAGSFDIGPNIENPTWFDFSPAPSNITFLNNNNNISTQNFCIEPVGNHKDIEVVFAPLEPARPGFDSSYKVVYKNKGNQLHSGSVTLNFDDTKTDLVSSYPAIDGASTNSLSWNYSNLMPFESRSIIVTLNLNSPMETPAINNGDILNFTTIMAPVVGEELPIDNQFTFNQTVVGSYDPNDITCLEGDIVAPSEIGNYLHYVINFENLGTFYAENVVVRSEIDPTKYDIASLQVMNTSHPSSTRIKGNVVEFVFEGIKLAEASGKPPVGGHGDVLFKIKSKNDLVINDTVLQKAGILFDYNFPIITNDAETTFAALNNTGFQLDASITIYPNPATTTIYIKSNTAIKTMNLYDIQGRIIETVIGNNTFLNISNQQNGIYFLKVTTDKGSKVEKIVKS